MNKRRLFARVVTYVLPVALVFGMAPVAAAEQAATERTVTANPSATISPQNHVFPSAVVGYGEQAVQVFTITNTGDVNLHCLGGGWPVGFGNRSGHVFGGIIRPGESITFDLYPRANSPVGTHIGEHFRKFIPASDENEFSRILNDAYMLQRSYIAKYLGITLEALDAWDAAEWNAFWGEYFNSPIGRQWEETRVEYLRSAGLIEIRATFSFTVLNHNINPRTGR